MCCRACKRVAVRPSNRLNRVQSSAFSLYLILLSREGSAFLLHRIKWYLLDQQLGEGIGWWGRGLWLQLCLFLIFVPPNVSLIVEQGVEKRLSIELYNNKIHPKPCCLVLWVLWTNVWLSSTTHFLFSFLCLRPVLSLLTCADPYWQPFISSSQGFSAWMSVKKASPLGAETAASGCGISTSNQLLSLISGKQNKDIKVLSNWLLFLSGVQKSYRLISGLLNLWEHFQISCFCFPY